MTGTPGHLGSYVYRKRQRHSIFKASFVAIIPPNDTFDHLCMQKIEQYCAFIFNGSLTGVNGQTVADLEMDIDTLYVRDGDDQMTFSRETSSHSKGLCLSVHTKPYLSLVKAPFEDLSDHPFFFAICSTLA